MKNKPGWLIFQSGFAPKRRKSRYPQRRTGGSARAPQRKTLRHGGKNDQRKSGYSGGKTSDRRAKEPDVSPEEVTLIAVSKTKPVEMIREAYEAGVRDFGENKVQELMDKIPQLPSDIRWHMIGHLQRNKVKYLVGKVEMIHSVDSLRLAEEISREAVKQGDGG